MRPSRRTFFVSNHRLGPLGFLNLAGVGGAPFAASGNVGMLDIVAALEWVRDAMPWKDLVDIATKVQRKLAAETAAANPSAVGLRLGFGPSVDGSVLPQHPYAPEAAPTAATVPMLICSTRNEQSQAWADPSLLSITLPQVAEKVKERAGFGPGFGDRAQAVVDAYAQAFPGLPPVEIWSLVTSNRQRVVTLADVKVKQPAPVYVAWFGWQPPLFDARIGAFHCVDICFWFHNTDLMLTHTGGGARPRRLAEKMAGALVQFMRAGDPNGQGLTPWPRYTSAKGETMVLDDVCAVQNDPDREARKALPAV